jgi:hypothetical protein
LHLVSELAKSDAKAGRWQTILDQSTSNAACWMEFAGPSVDLQITSFKDAHFRHWVFFGLALIACFKNIRKHLGQWLYKANIQPNQPIFCRLDGGYLEVVNVADPDHEVQPKDYGTLGVLRGYAYEYASDSTMPTITFRKEDGKAMVVTMLPMPQINLIRDPLKNETLLD